MLEKARIIGLLNNVIYFSIEILLLTLCMALTTLGSGIGWNIPAKVLILSTVGVILATTIICCVFIHKAGAQ